MRTLHEIYMEQALEGIAFLDDMGGPDTPEEYVKVLEDLKKEIDRRISVAKNNGNQGV